MARASRPHSPSVWSTGLIVLLAVLSARSGAAEAWRLDTALDTPAWLTLTGSFRARYESLDGQYRVERSPSDQLASLRTTLLAEAQASRVRAGLELFDARAYLGDAGSSVGPGEVNVLEPLQAYVAFRAGDDDAAELMLGRFTMDLGSRRFVGRHAFRNTTAAFTGARLDWRAPADGRLTLFYVLPQQIQPSDRADILDNEQELDDEDSNLRFWGAFVGWPSLWQDLSAEVFVFGLNESDDAGRPSANRQFVTPGFRLFRTPAPRQWDMELEAAWQFGERRATADPADVRDLDVSAATVHAEAGFALDAAWRPRLEINYDFASGEDPGDGRWQRFDPLYGPRRPDWGPAGLYGPLSRVNVSAPGIKLEVQPGSRSDAFVEYKAVWLAEKRDTFDRSGAVDPTGESGSFVGHQLQLRMRYWLVPDALQLDVGAATLIHGRFLEQAPNAPDHGDTVYGYADLTWTF